MSGAIRPYARCKRPRDPEDQEGSASCQQQPSCAGKAEAWAGAHFRRAGYCRGCGFVFILGAATVLILRPIVLDRRHAPAEVDQRQTGKLRDFSLAAITCLLVGGERRSKITPLLEEYSEIERAGGVAALVRALVCVERGVRVALLFEQYPEVGRGGRMAPLIGATVGLLRLGELSAILQLDSEIERAVGVAGLVREPVRVPRRRHATPSRGGAPSCPSR